MTVRPAVQQVLATLGYGDAIGHEALGAQRVLRAAGYRSNIYVQTADPRLEHLTEDYRDLLDDSHAYNILLHHFSIGSKASRVAFALPDRMVLVYHNITPPSYFIGVNTTLVQLCWSGRRELRGYAARCDLALGDSEFNRRDLEAIGFPRTGVLPVVPSFDHLDVPPDRALAADFDDRRTNFLFVGRMIPNKAIGDVIRFFHAYRLRYDRTARLLLVSSLAAREPQLLTDPIGAQDRLRVALEGTTHELVIIDCPPSLGLLTVNGLFAADRALVVTEPGAWASDGVGEILRTIERISSRRAASISNCASNSLIP